MSIPERGEVWLIDLGYAAKTRPGLVLSIPYADDDRAVISFAPHTTSTRGSHFEIVVPKSFLKTGAFDAQGLAGLPSVKFIRNLGRLTPEEMTEVEDAVRHWLGL